MTKANLFEGLKLRRKLVKAVRLAVAVDPKIYYVSNTKLIFAVPHGTDPTKLLANAYIFRQIFGSEAELDGDLKRFDLTIPARPLPAKLTYSFEDWQDVCSDASIPVICGVDALGKHITFDMSERPHSLISGETGAGKSSLLRAILTTLILSKKPDQVRLLLGDLKRSEFGLFRNLPHVDSVCVEKTDLARELGEVNRELDRRGRLLDDAGVTHISELDTPLPYIIVCIDEVALLKREKRIMAIIERISAVGRSLGVLLILSMQRPDAKTLDGALKNNLTVRISGRQSNLTNANVAGVPGAELIKQSERGRMIIALEGVYKRIQAPWLAYKDARILLDPLRLYDDNTANISVEEAPLFGVLDGGESE